MKWFDDLESELRRREQEHEDWLKRLRRQNVVARERSVNLRGASASAYGDRPAGRGEQLSSKYAHYPTCRVCGMRLAEMLWEKGVHFGRCEERLGFR